MSRNPLVLAVLLPLAALTPEALAAQQVVVKPRVLSPPAPAAAAAPVPAAQTMRVLQGAALTRFDAAAPDRVPNATARFVEVLRHVPIGDAPPRSLGLTIGQSARGPMLLTRGTAEQIDAVAAALAALARTDVGPTRLQCSLVTMPVAVATAHRLEPGKTVLGDGAAWGELVRDAVEQKGRVHNLAEVTATPLEPFTRDIAAPARAADGPRHRLCGEVVPLGRDEVALAVAIERGRASAPDAKLPVLASPVFRLAAGRSAMMMALDGDTAVVVIVRCLEATPPLGK